MHRRIVITIAVAAIMLSLMGLLPSSSWMLFGLAAAIAVIGVPHGGLDHWVGKDLLSQRFPATWLTIFFALYLLVALIVVVGWVYLPVFTLITFVVLSAWHFGIEDELESVFDAIALGGLVIWIPSLFRSSEMVDMLIQVMPGDSMQLIQVAMPILQGLAILSLVYAVLRLVSSSLEQRALQSSHHFAFAALFTFAPILVSFGIYFCGWHSVRGLMRLAREQKLSASQFALAVTPLSLGAVAIIAVSGWWLNSGGGLDQRLTQTLFIGLSAIAVPHLLLHQPRWLHRWTPSRLGIVDTVRGDVL